MLYLILIWTSRMKMTRTLKLRNIVKEISLQMYLVTASWKADIVQSNICFVISSNNTFKSNSKGGARVQLYLSTNPVPIGWITCKHKTTCFNLLLVLFYKTPYMFCCKHDLVQVQLLWRVCLSKSVFNYFFLHIVFNWCVIDQFLCP